MIVAWSLLYIWWHIKISKYERVTNSKKKVDWPVFMRIFHVFSNYNSFDCREEMKIREDIRVSVDGYSL